MGTVKSIVVKDFLNQSEQTLLNNYMMIRHMNNKNSFDETIGSCNADTGYYADPLAESLLISKKQLMEKETKYSLLPTYSYWRMYTHNANLIRHKDRVACEISVTIQVTSSGESWPIYVNDKPYNLKNGDALIYPGRECFHFRENFKGDYSGNLFLHYVNANGEYKDQHLDKRTFWKS